MSQPSTLSVLLIDDCAEDRADVCQYLQQDSLYSYQIVELETAKQAMKWCQQQIPDLILLNFTLPDGNGLEFLEQLRKYSSYTQSAIILITEQGDTVTAIRALKSGAQDYLAKDFLNAQILQETVHHAVERVQLARLLEEHREQQQQLIAAIALRIRQSLKLEEILGLTAKEVRQFLKADRVLVYQFSPDLSGSIVAESVFPGWRVSLGVQIQDTCFQMGGGSDYRQGKKRAVDNIYQAGLTDCHLQLLAEFEVKAYLVVPILVTNQLWGLLIAQQCSATRHWETGELDLLDQLGVQIAIAIQQASAYQQVQKELMERQLAEAALRESEERFRCTFEQAAVGMSLVSLNGQFLRLNQRFCDIAAYPESELINLNFQQITHPEDLAADLEQLSMLLAGKIHTYSLEKRYIRKDGTSVWINLTVSLVRNAAGTPQYFISVIEDISERIFAQQALQQLNEELEARVKQRTAALQESEERLTLALKSSNIGIWDWNITHNKIYWDERMFELYGIQHISSVRVYHHWLNALHPDDRAEVTASLKQALGGEKEFDTEFRIVLPDGSIRFIKASAIVKRNQQGIPQSIVGINYDISDRKQAEADMRAALEKERELSLLRSRFISMASHEFRTPLTIISSSAGILEAYNHRLSEEKKQQHLQRIQNSIQHMTQLLDDVLTINRAENERLPFEPESVDLVTFCRNLVEELQLSTDKHKIIFVASHNHQPLATLTAAIDQKLMRQIITNILNNAIKYSPENNIINFDLLLHNNEVVFQIQDYGIGIPEEDQTQLFESFQRGRNVGSIGGTGLGLVIVKKCVDLHKGQIDVSSKIGEGTIIKVTIPC